MKQVARLTAGGLILLIAMIGFGNAAGNQFSCKGQVIQQGTPDPTVPPKTIDLNVSLTDKNEMSIKIADDKTLVPRITSNNKIQLKFVAEDFVGEYFHYTGDLFLIYNSGQLARLNCSHS